MLHDSQVIHDDKQVVLLLLFKIKPKDPISIIAKWKLWSFSIWFQRTVLLCIQAVPNG